MRSGVSSRAFSRAAGPSAATMTSKPDFSRLYWMISTISGSSSTTSIVCRISILRWIAARSCPRAPSLPDAGRNPRVGESGPVRPALRMRGWIAARYRKYIESAVPLKTQNSG